MFVPVKDLLKIFKIIGVLHKKVYFLSNTVKILNKKAIFEEKD